MPSRYLNNWDFLGGSSTEDSYGNDYTYTSSSNGFDDNESWGMLNDSSSFGGEMQGSRMFDFLSDPVPLGQQLLLPSASKLHYFNNSTFSSVSEPVSPSSVETTPTSSEQPISAPREVSSSATPLKKRKRSPASPTAYSKTALAGGDYGRKKKYDAPPGVWRNSGGFISTVYINKKRVYGPLRRDVADAVKDREEMSIAKSYITSEDSMRAFVQEMKTRYGPDRVMCEDFSSYNGGIPRVESSSDRVISRSKSSSSRPSSNRPVRAAAKRNAYIGSDEEDDSTILPPFEEEAVLASPFDFM
jgi:hypothetical protein